MKYLPFLASFLFFCLSTYAQDSSVNLKKLETFKLPDFKIKKIPFTYSEKLGTKIFSADKILLQHGITILPLDKMPCFVPDVATVSKMPNQQSRGSAVRIPNKSTVVEVK